MEMLKKLMIVLAITGSCAVQAAVGSSSDASSLVRELKDFYDKSVAEIKKDALEKYPECDGFERRCVSISSSDPEGIWEDFDLRVEANLKRDEYLNMALRRPIELAAQQIGRCIERPKKTTGFAAEKINEMNVVYKDIYNLLSASDDFYFGYQNQSLLIKDEQSRKQVKALVDQALLLHKTIHDLLEEGEKTKVFGQRSPENKELINNCVNRLGSIYSAMVQVFKSMKDADREESKKASLDQYRRSGEAARNKESSRQHQREIPSRYEAWCEAGYDPDKYW